MELEKNLCVDVNSKACIGHTVQNIIIDKDNGIKAIYCTQDDRIVQYLFRRNRGWDEARSTKYAKHHTNVYSKFNQVSVDNSEAILKVIGTSEDGTTVDYKPNSESYTMTAIEKSWKYIIGLSGTTPETAHFHGFVQLENTGNGATPEQNGHVHEIKDYVVQQAEGHTHPLIEVATGQEFGKKEGHHTAIIAEIENAEKSKTQRCVTLSEDSTIFATCWHRSLTDKPELEKVQFDAGKITAEKAKEICKAMGLEFGRFIEAGQKEAPKVKIYATDEALEIVKVDEERRLVYGVFLFPERPDHDGDVISPEDIEKVAHDFMADYRAIDEMHRDVIEADIVESFIAWEDGMKYYGKELMRGAWCGAVKIHDDKVWDKVKQGIYKGFSVRISGIREPIEE